MKSEYALRKGNFILLAVSFFIIVIGFVLMIGGGSEGKEFNPEIYSTQRITVGPMISLFGFVLAIFAILWTPKGNGNKFDKMLGEGEESENDMQ